jgi:hypothetical protein
MATELDKRRTHVVWGARRFGKRGQTELLEVGYGWIDEKGVAHSILNRTPFNGFTGYTQLVLRGEEPVMPTQYEKPHRPGEDDEDQPEDDA